MRTRCSTPLRLGGTLEYCVYTECVNEKLTVGLYQLLGSAGPLRIGASCVFSDDHVVVDKHAIRTGSVEKAMMKATGWLRLKGPHKALEAAAEAIVQHVVPAVVRR